VVELKVDEESLIERIEKRIRETKAKGQSVRADDDPVVLKQRIVNYRKQTLPLSDYYHRKGTLAAIDGMRPVDQVEAEIEQALSKRVSAGG
jgi:adenylate kinase